MARKKEKTGAECIYGERHDRLAVITIYDFKEPGQPTSSTAQVANSATTD